MNPQFTIHMGSVSYTAIPDPFPLLVSCRIVLPSLDPCNCASVSGACICFARGWCEPVLRPPVGCSGGRERPRGLWRRGSRLGRSRWWLPVWEPWWVWWWFSECGVEWDWKRSEVGGAIGGYRSDRQMLVSAWWDEVVRRWDVTVRAWGEGSEKTKNKKNLKRCEPQLDWEKKVETLEVSGKSIQRLTPAEGRCLIFAIWSVVLCFMQCFTTEPPAIGWDF